MSSFLESLYPLTERPCLEWVAKRWEKFPFLSGKTVLSAIPLFMNTLCSLEVLKKSGAQVIITNHPDWPLSDAVLKQLNNLNLNYTPFEQCPREVDIIIDTGDFVQKQIQPRDFAIELTRSGILSAELRLQNQTKPTWPLWSADDSPIKFLEDVFGMGDGFIRAIDQLLGPSAFEKGLVIFGGGKVGSGIATQALRRFPKVSIVEKEMRFLRLPAALRNRVKVKIFDDISQEWIQQHGGAVTATARAGVMSERPIQNFFKDLWLANVGVDDEWGCNFSSDAVLANKKPVNFILKDPTQMFIIEAIFAGVLMTVEIAHEKLRTSAGAASPVISTAKINPMPKEAWGPLLNLWWSTHSNRLSEEEKCWEEIIFNGLQ